MNEKGSQVTTAHFPVIEHPEVTSAPRARRRHLIIPIIGTLLGIVLLLYPVVSTRIHDAAQQEAANKYAEKTEVDNPEEYAQQLAAADKYNQDLYQGLILDPFLADVAPDSPEYQAYLKQLADGDSVIAQVIVPTAKINLPIYHGTFEESLQRGAGHLFGSSLPVGGKSSHSVITGHTGLQNMTLFDHLTDVSKGDSIYINVLGRHLKYEVTNIKVVLPTQTDDLRRETGKDLITLVTCTPYGVNSHRLLVTGTRVPIEKKEAANIVKPQPVSVPWQTWMIALVSTSVIALLLLIGLVARLIILWPRTKRRFPAQLRNHSR